MCVAGVVSLMLGSCNMYYIQTPACNQPQGTPGHPGAPQSTDDRARLTRRIRRPRIKFPRQPFGSLLATIWQLLATLWQPFGWVEA